MQIDQPEEMAAPPERDPIGPLWVEKFIEIESESPQETDRQDRLFSILFRGSRPDGNWTTADRKYYLSQKKALWDGRVLWPSEVTPAGYDRFHSHLNRLAMHYDHGQDGRNKFARAAGLIWGGIAYQGPVFKALAAASVGDHFLQLHEGAEGWKSRFVDDANPAHHWVAAFLTGFIYGAIIGTTVNAIRDIAQFITAQGGTMADIDLGNVAAEHGAFLAHGDEDDETIYQQLLARMRADLRAE